MLRRPALGVCYWKDASAKGCVVLGNWTEQCRTFGEHGLGKQGAFVPESVTVSLNLVSVKVLNDSSFTNQLRMSEGRSNRSLCTACSLRERLLKVGQPLPRINWLVDRVGL